MTRTTRAQLDELCNIINHALLCAPGTRCTDLDPELAYRIEYAYGSPRLVRLAGSVDVSPRLPAGELAQWMRAYIDGIDVGRLPPGRLGVHADRLTVTCKRCGERVGALLDYEAHARQHEAHDAGACTARGHWDANGSGDWHCIHEPCSCLPPPAIEVLTREPDGFSALLVEPPGGGRMFPADARLHGWKGPAA